MIKQADAIKTHTTGGMSANNWGSVESTWEGLFNGRSLSCAGNITLSGSTSWSGGDNSAGGKPTTMTIDVSHTHTYSGAVETRPQNYTVRIWKRTA